MNHEITIEVKTHAIITYSKSHYLITNDQNEKLKHLNSNDLLDIDGSQVAVKNIAEIMTIQKYYETFPEKKPVPKVNQFEKYESITQRSIGKKGIEQMVVGLQKFIDSVNGKAPNATRERDRLIKKLERI